MSATEQTEKNLDKLYVKVKGKIMEYYPKNYFHLCGEIAEIFLDYAETVIK